MPRQAAHQNQVEPESVSGNGDERGKVGGMDKGMGVPSMDDMLGQLKAMQAQIEEAQTALAEDTVEVSAGGGGLKVVMSGTQVLKRIEIAPELVETGDVALLEDAIMAAVNQALQESQALAVKRLGPLAGAMGGGG
jgi:DNA-binding YbaB/EbfC family protein